VFSFSPVVQAHYKRRADVTTAALQAELAAAKDANAAQAAALASAAAEAEGLR